MDTRSFLFSTLIAGVAIGLLGNLPVLNLINCALCIWVWLGGILAVVLYRWFQQSKPGPSVAQGAGLGALSGLIGALVGAVVFAVTSPLSVPLFNSLARTFGVEGDLPFRAGGFGEIVGTAFIFLVLDSVLYPIFGALGGVIAASFTKEPRS
ncbi:MAG: hypothetical protein AMJ56_19860 [Anaerolineae bacterium SG8_19]|jgi:hypothetical protein|nr:MAG: hypothetical protein AMJ56_19860 [Anaerolineae bacterium SG8_19]